MPFFEGLYTALITPFQNGEIDFESMKKIIADQMKSDIDGLVVLGTTGESPTITTREREKIIRFVVSEVNCQVPIIVGTGTNNTETTIESSRAAKEYGAQGTLVVTPYYNKPPQRGMIDHYKRVAESVEIPMLLYNVPGRTGVSLSIDSIEELSTVDQIVGIKEATGNIEFASEIKKKCGKDFVLLSGDDPSVALFLDTGGDGAISVLSHIVPKEMKKFISEREDFSQFDEIQKLLSIESNPIPVKMAMFLMGLISSPELRAPLSTLSDEHKVSLKNELRNLKKLEL